MPFRRTYRKRKYIRRRKGGVVRKAVRRARSTAFKKKVLSVIHKVAENKISQHSQQFTLVPDVPRTTGVDCFQIVPSVTSTPSSGTFYRTGEKIKLRSLVIKGYYTYAPSAGVGSTHYNNMALRIMVVMPKANRNLTDIQSNTNQWIQNLLQNGNTAQQFSNSVTNSIYYPLNRELLNVYYDKLVFLNQPYQQQVTASGIMQLPTKDLTRHFHIRIPVKDKTLLYDASMGNTGINSTNFNPVLIFGLVQMDGYAGTSTNGGVSYTSHMEWEDL